MSPWDLSSSVKWEFFFEHFRREAYFGGWFQRIYLHLLVYMYTFFVTAAESKINAYKNRYGKDSDNVREPSSTARQLKPKLYNTVKSKSLSVREFKYILAVIYTVLEI